MSYFPKTNPAALGFALVATPGTPVSLISGTAAAVGQQFKCNSLELEATKAPKTNNVGSVYIGEATMVRSTGVGVIKVIAPGDTWPFTQQIEGNVLYPENLFIDADNAGDGVLVRALVR